MKRDIFSCFYNFAKERNYSEKAFNHMQSLLNDLCEDICMGGYEVTDKHLNEVSVISYDKDDKHFYINNNKVTNLQAMYFIENSLMNSLELAWNRKLINITKVTNSISRNDEYAVCDECGYINTFDSFTDALNCKNDLLGCRE